MSDYVINLNPGFITHDSLMVNDIDPKDRAFTRLNRQKDQRKYILSLAKAVETLSVSVGDDNPAAVYQMQMIADRLKAMAKNYKIKVSMREQYRRASEQVKK
jgi:hypothetical protein